VDVQYPYLVAGDLNVYNPATDPCRLLSFKEDSESTPYFRRAAHLGFILLTTPGVYTWFPFTGTHRSSAIDLAFANPRIFPAFPSWDASTLPATGSDHTPISIPLRPSSSHHNKPRPRWQEADWPNLTDGLKGWLVPLPPDTPSLTQLHQWFSSALSALTTTIEVSAPCLRPSLRSKPWWTPLLTILRKEVTNATRQVKKHQTSDTFLTARQSKLGYFKAIKRPKASYRADFVTKTSPNNIWTAKQLVATRKTPGFPSLPDASDTVMINKALLDHFFPPKDPLPGRGRLRRNPSAVPLSKDEITLARSKSSPSSAPGPEGIPYSVWKRVNLINHTIILDLLSPLVALGYHPP